MTNFMRALHRIENPDDSVVMSLSQKPIHGSIFGTEAGEPARKTKPNWYQISDRDRMIPPATQRKWQSVWTREGFYIWMPAMLRWQHIQKKLQIL